ncbi:MAG: HypC/HybG/HupF family hydrogenase formation chaperone [Thermoflexales bacterium]|nr:HypC/HybG/HupF family hydrogenase formation chaperone [Thermoflexales bacterium]MDW8350735.1 HypC/HybG/HupF family hydrogenase formation chaperone [Anaerolineae bacterium]
MCLGIPGRVQAIYEADGVRMGKVNFGGIVKDVCLEYVPEVAVGDYTIVHVGFAITRVDEASAQESLRLFREMGMLDEELRPEQHAGEVAPPACPVDPWGGAADDRP